MIDTHTHTLFSHDGNNTIDEMAARAVELGLPYLGITDHYDADCVFYENMSYIRQLDLPAYHAALTEAKQRWAGKIILGVGIETSFEPKATPTYLEMEQKYCFDNVINSVHLCNGKDPYEDDYYDNYSQDKCYEDFMNVLLASVDAPYFYSTIAHLGYVARKAPYPKKMLKYVQHADVLDELFKRIIAKDKCLEVNTHTGVSFEELYDYNLFRRYYALGGRNVAFASDAHTPDRICDKYATVSDMLRSIGFKYYTYFVDKKPIRIKI